LFESKDRLEGDVAGLLAAIREGTGGWYACVLDPKGVLYESARESAGSWVLRRYVEERLPALFRLPGAMASGAEIEDVFGDWESPAGDRPDEFVLAVVNGRVALLVACPEAEKAEASLFRPLRALADRLFRLNPAWRLDEGWRGLFLTRPKLDIVVIGRPQS
jgi:hypothetical protein